LKLLALHLKHGRKAESLAAKMMQSENYKIVARNVNYPCGEIDLIAQNHLQIVFVEVRSRASKEFGLPEETVGRNKQQKIIAAAKLWLQKNDPSGEFQCRFDVIGFSAGKPSWIKNAFEAT